MLDIALIIVNCVQYGRFSLILVTATELVNKELNKYMLLLFLDPISGILV